MFLRFHFVLLLHTYFSLIILLSHFNNFSESVIAHDKTLLVIYVQVWPWHIAVHITYLISHSSSLSSHLVKYILGWVYNKYKTTLVC